MQTLALTACLSTWYISPMLHLRILGSMAKCICRLLLKEMAECQPQTVVTKYLKRVMFCE